MGTRAAAYRARVAALSGAAYAAAYDEYMAAKGHAEAIADEGRRRGVRGRRAGTALSRPSSTEFRFAVASSPATVIAAADGAVRFPDPERVALRDELRRAAVAELTIGERQVLRGTFAGSLPTSAKTDVENRVLLNMSLPGRCLRRGFCFEHNPDPPAGWMCGYSYDAVESEDPFKLWSARRRLVGWQNVPLAHELTAASIWWALRAARDPGVAGPATVVPGDVVARDGDLTAAPVAQPDQGGRRRRCRRRSMDADGQPEWPQPPERQPWQG